MLETKTFKTIYVCFLFHMDSGGLLSGQLGIFFPGMQHSLEQNFIFNGFNAFLENMTESKMFLLKLKLYECATLGILPGFCCFHLFSQAKAGITSIHAMRASFLFTKQ